MALDLLFSFSSNVFLETFQEAATGESLQNPCEEEGVQNNKQND